MKYLVIGPEGHPVEVTQEQHGKWFVGVGAEEGELCLSATEIGDCVIYLSFTGIEGCDFSPFAVSLRVKSTDIDLFARFSTRDKAQSFMDSIIKLIDKHYIDLENVMNDLFQSKNAESYGEAPISLGGCTSEEMGLVNQIIASDGKE